MILLLIIFILMGAFLVSLNYIFLSMAIVGALIFLIRILVSAIQGHVKKKQTAIYAKQLENFSPNARFVLAVYPLAYVGRADDLDIEKKVKLKDEIRNLARKYGWSSKQGEVTHFYSIGYNEIGEAQKQLVMAQEKGKEIMFYLLMRKYDGKYGRKGIRGFVVSEYDSDERETIYALKNSGIATKKNWYNLNDTERLLAVRSYDEGKASYTRLNKSQKVFPPYYYYWTMYPGNYPDLMKEKNWQ
ncbi:MAG: hypothetical protein IKL25_08005 [Clostridia bacterium]|nr:hypothetical protein [Clostridia bacterium]